MKFFPTRSISKLASVFSLLFLLFANSAAHAVEYEATFNGLWNATHATSYPAGAHFSDLVGATHTSGTAFWKTGELASKGVEDVAELGDPTEMLDELAAAAQSGFAGPAINFGSLFNLPNSSTIRFEAETDKPFITLISMIAPSPDWFVGVSGLSLRANGRWIEALTVQLRPYDAGTEEGNTFSLDNSPTNPIDPISTLSGLPFNGRPSLGTISFRLVTPQPQPNNSGEYIPAIISTLLE